MNHPNNFIREAFAKAEATLAGFISNPQNFADIERAAQLMAESIKAQGKIFSCGNGGSTCDAMHFAEELTGRFRKDRPSLPAISIADPAHLTCVANDFGYQYVFSRFLEGWAREGDVLLAISTSGNSKNVVNAVQVAKNKGVTSIGLLGKTGGELKGMADLSIVVDSEETERIQEIHIKIIHTIIEGIERILFPENYRQ